MRLNSLRFINGPSLFHDRPCVLATFQTGPSISGPTQPSVESTIQDHWPALSSSRWWRERLPTDDLPAQLGLIQALCGWLLEALDQPVDGFRLSSDPAQKKLFLAIAEQHRPLTSRVIEEVCRYVLSLCGGAGPDGREVKAARAALQWMRDNAQDLGKKRATRDMQRHLAEGHTPWLALDFHPQDRDLLQLGFGRQQKLVNGTVGDEASHLGVEVSLSKQRTLHFLSLAGFSVPTQFSAANVEQACRGAQQIGFPVVVKSEYGTHGKRVFADLRNEQEVAGAFRLLTGQGPASQILVEQHVPGRVYRMEVVAGKLLNVFEMIPARVVGDGTHSIVELVERENREPTRQHKEESDGLFVTLTLGDAEKLVLRKQGLQPGDVPAAGQEVLLSANSNWSIGGTFRRVTSIVHPDNRRLAEQVADAMKLDLTGIDVITRDISRSFVDEPLTIIEVNHSPGIISYTNEEENDRVDSGPRLVARLQPDAHYGDVPVMTFRQSPLSSPTVRQLAARLDTLGYASAWLDGQTLKVGGEPVARPDPAQLLDPALMMLRRTDAGGVITERPPAALADHGIGSGGCDIALIMGGTETTITTPAWSAGLAVRELDRMLASAARLAAIVLADTPQALNLCAALSPEKLIVITPPEQAPDEGLLGRGARVISARQQEGGGWEAFLQQGERSETFDLEAMDADTLVARLACHAALYALGQPWRGGLVASIA